ncbi:MAG: signal peptidase I [Verrucomicrobia bacterium]|nr:signal peptidase I [Verrucomicrobiota bacterium]MDA1046847.1 signal peptidase I [Verrucomicrobiota bacterium]
MTKPSNPENKPVTRSMRKGAKEILRLAQKAFDYRRDLLPDEDVEKFENRLVGLDKAIREKTVTTAELEEKATDLYEISDKCGGDYYHKKSWVENIEMLLVAAIVVIGIRSFFIQPFIIPTNSMYPTYNGMQPNLYEEDDELPGMGSRILDKLTLGASHHRLEAQSNGELVLVLQDNGSFRFSTENFPNGKFFVFPSPIREYVFEIGGKKHVLNVPSEFDLDTILAKKFAGIDDLRGLPQIIPQPPGLYNSGRLRLSENSFKAGDVVLAFDILLGDALFVDRMSYNFIRPSSGDPAVFKTKGIDEVNRQLDIPTRSSIGEDKYYIKRLVGEPGDEMEIRVPDTIFTNGTDLRGGTPGILYRNGKPIEGVDAFRMNRERVENLAQNPQAENTTKYPGYRADGLLSNKSPLRVPKKTDRSTNPTGQNFYLAMGDNSPNSLDGRMWGFVPEQQIVGRALFVYYPFTNHWGLSK